MKQNSEHDGIKLIEVKIYLVEIANDNLTNNPNPNLRIPKVVTLTKARQMTAIDTLFEMNLKKLLVVISSLEQK